MKVYYKTIISDPVKLCQFQIKINYVTIKVYEITQFFN